jgi:hypothetical protein
MAYPSLPGSAAITLPTARSIASSPAPVSKQTPVPVESRAIPVAAVMGTSPVGDHSGTGCIKRWSPVSIAATVEPRWSAT